MRFSRLTILAAACLLPCLCGLCSALLTFAPGHFQTSANATEPAKSIAVEGAAASLVCKFTLPADDAVRLIFWYKGANATGTPMYIVDARNKSLATATHFPGDASGRLSFDVSSFPPTLKIRTVFAEDYGLHYCRVDFRRSRTFITSLFLDVVVPPRKILILDEYSQIMSGSIGPFDEGSSISVVCESEGGKPAPALTWYLGPGAIKASSSSSSNIGDVVVRTQLNLTLTRDHYNKTLTCKAQNSYFSISKSVILDMNLHPSRIWISSHRESFISGSSTRIVCQTTGSRPFAELTWYLDNKMLPSASESFSSFENSSISVTRSVIELVLKPDDDGSRLRCRAQNKAFVDTFIEDVILLSVFYPPSTQLTWRGNSSSSLELVKGTSSQSCESSYSSRHLDKRRGAAFSVSVTAKGPSSSGQICLKEGDELLLQCFSRANPSVHLIKWLFNGQVLGGDSRYNGVIINGETLFVRPVRKEHSGKFSCSATNSEGSADSNQLSLSVRYAPVCRPAQKIFYGVAAGETVIVSCEVDADPNTNVSFTWRSLSNRTLPSTDTDLVGPRSFLHLSPLSPQDYGTLSCRAANSVGTQLEPCLFTILPAGPPEPLRGCRLSNSTFLLFEVHCTPGYDGGLPQTVHLDVYESNSDASLDVYAQRNNANFTLHELRPNRTYILHAYSSNAKGRSSSLVLPLTTAPVVSHGAPASASSGLPAMIHFVLVSLMVLLLATLVAVTFWLQRRARLKNEQSKDEWSEMALPTNPDVIPSDKEMFELDGLGSFCKESPDRSARPLPLTTSAPSLPGHFVQPIKQ